MMLCKVGSLCSDVGDSSGKMGSYANKALHLWGLEAELGFEVDL